MSNLIDAGDAVCDGGRLTVGSLSRKVVGRDQDNAYDGKLNPNTSTWKGGVGVRDLKYSRI
jgi:hypothetical protein